MATQVQQKLWNILLLLRGEDCYDPPYGYVVGDTVYYGEGGGAFSLTAVLSDRVSGLTVLTVPATTGPGAVYPQGGALTATVEHGYDFDAADNLTTTVTVTATDRAGHAVTQPFTVANDVVAPTLTVTAPLTAPLRFPVTWSATDGGSGVRDYDVQYRDAVTTTWTPWLTSTTGTEAEFTGAPGGSYYFRVKATDNVSNESDWVEAGPVDINAVTKNYFSGGQLVATRRGDALYYIHGDHLGSTSLTTDQSGTLVAEARRSACPSGRSGGPLGRR